MNLEAKLTMWDFETEVFAALRGKEDAFREAVCEVFRAASHAVQDKLATVVLSDYDNRVTIRCCLSKPEAGLEAPESVTFTVPIDIGRALSVALKDALTPVGVRS